MIFKITCPHCNRTLKSKKDLTGSRTTCPKCGEKFVVKRTTSTQTIEKASIPPAATSPQRFRKKLTPEQRMMAFPSPPYCWYCIDLPPNIAGDKSACVERYRLVSQIHRGRKVLVTRRGTAARVPRCPRCKQIHDMCQMVNVAILALTFVLVVLGFYKLNPNASIEDLIPFLVFATFITGIVMFISPVFYRILCRFCGSYAGRLASLLPENISSYNNGWGNRHPRFNMAEQAMYDPAYEKRSQTERMGGKLVELKSEAGDELLSKDELQRKYGFTKGNTVYYNLRDKGL